MIDNTPPIQNASGDFSGNGATDAWDITYLARSIAGISGYETLSSGDVSGDGSVDVLDVDSFVLALVDPGAFASQYPDGNFENADVNADGFVNGNTSPVCNVGGFVG